MRTTAVTGTSQATSRAGQRSAARAPRRRWRTADSGGRRRRHRQGVPQRDDDSDHDRADHPACRPRRVLRGGRAARPARAAGAAGRRRRRGWRGRARRRLGGELRGAPLRDPLGDVVAGGVPALPGRGLPAGRRPPLPAGQSRRHGHPPALHAAGRADLDRRGVPRRHRVGGAVRRRADHRPRGSRTRRAPRSG